MPANTKKQKSGKEIKTIKDTVVIDLSRLFYLQNVKAGP